MLTIQVSCKNSTNGHWNSVAHYKTRRGANNFITKNKARYPEDVFNIRIIGEEEVEPEAPNCRQVVKIGNVFVENPNDWDDNIVFYEAYIVVGFTPSGKSVRVKKLVKIDVSDKINGRNSVTWKVKFVKPSDDFMKSREDVKTVRLSNYKDDIFFDVNSVKTASLDEKFNYNHVYIEGLFE